MRNLRADVRAIAFLICVALVGAACGSTVPVSQREAVGVTDDGLGVTGGGGLPEGARINDKGQVVSASGEVLGTAEDFGISTNSDGGAVSGGTASAGSNFSGGGGNDPGAAASAPGVTDSKIYLGIPYVEAGPANQAAFGASLDSDARKYYNAMIEYINKRGGLFGRQVEPLYYKFDGTSSQTIDQQRQAACSYWTEDNEVFAILTGEDVIQRCAEEAGALSYITYAYSLPEDFQRYPHYFESSGINLVRAAPATVTGLDRQGYFGRAPKLGIVLWDDSEYRTTLGQGYLPALEDRGIELATEPAYITPPQTAQDLGATSADVNSAVLRFQAQGITHVMILGGGSGLCAQACLETFFLRRADSQDYLPRYGFNALNLPIAGMEAGLYPRRQLRRSLSVEWNDFDKSYDQGWRVNQARERCFEIMRKAQVPMDNANRQGDARGACEQLWFFQLIQVKLGDAPLTADNFMVGVNRVASGFQSPNAYAVHLSESRHDGIAAARNMKFVNSCECYKFTSDPYRI